MWQTIVTSLALIGMLAAMLLALELGRRFGKRRMQQDATGAHSGNAALEGAVFGLLGLLIAFTFSGAANRFDARRELLLKETNAIGTAWLRLDLLPGPAHRELLEEFRRYVDQRLEATRAGAVRADDALSSRQARIWKIAVAAARDTGDLRVTQLLLPALNDMFDVATSRYMAAQTHPPGVIYAMLLLLSLVCAAMAGYGMAASRHRNWLHILTFAGSLIFALYVTLEIEFPRRGLIRLDRYDQVMVDLRTGMQ